MRIELRGVTVRQGAFRLEDASFAVASGSYGVVLGAAGAGKTPWLEAGAGVRPVARGAVLLDDDDATSLPPEEREAYSRWPDQPADPRRALGFFERFGLPDRLERD